MEFRKMVMMTITMTITMVAMTTMTICETMKETQM